MKPAAALPCTRKTTHDKLHLTACDLRCSALAKLDAELHENFVVLEEAARQNAAGVGAKDLQRLQLQNASLKGSSMHMHVREEFLDALAFDGPDGRFPRGDEAQYRAALQVGRGLLDRAGRRHTCAVPQSTDAEPGASRRGRSNAQDVSELCFTAFRSLDGGGALF